jgi:hypothetical protein
MFAVGAQPQPVLGPAVVWEPQLLTAGLLLVGALLAGAVVIAWVGRWSRRAQPTGLSPSDQLAQFRSLYEQGAISQEEFDRLRELLGSQMKEHLNVSPSEPAKDIRVQAPPSPAPVERTERPPEPPPDGIRPV